MAIFNGKTHYFNGHFQVGKPGTPSDHRITFLGLSKAKDPEQAAQVLFRLCPVTGGVPVGYPAVGSVTGVSCNSSGGVWFIMFY